MTLPKHNILRECTQFGVSNIKVGVIVDLFHKSSSTQTAPDIQHFLKYFFAGTPLLIDCLNGRLLLHLGLGPLPTALIGPLKITRLQVVTTCSSARQQPPLLTVAQLSASSLSKCLWSRTASVISYFTGGQVMLQYLWAQINLRGRELITVAAEHLLTGPVFVPVLFVLRNVT